MSQDQSKAGKDAAAAAGQPTQASAAPSTGGVKGSEQTATPLRKLVEPTDEAVLNYLQKRGMGSAALELSRILRDRHHKQVPPSTRSQLEFDDRVARNQRSLLSRTTGGGFGYDVDGAPSIAQWGVPDTLADGKSDAPPPENASLGERMGRDEARAYVDSFTALQTWVLSLPDDPSTAKGKMKSKNKQSDGDTLGISIASVIKAVAGDSEIPDEVSASVKALENRDIQTWMPPSAKPELLAVSFALFVHTYCELLEVGMETTAKSLFDAFQPIYDPLYRQELADLRKCDTTEEVMRLNSHNQVYLESLSMQKAIMVQVSNFQSKKQELNQDSLSSNAQVVAARQRKIAEYDQNVALLKQKYEEVSKRAVAADEKTQHLPFLRRARAIRWQLSLSATTYGMLASYLSSKEVLLPISTLLQTKCEVHVERRDPLPYTPPTILDDMVAEKGSNSEDVRWAAPIPPTARLAEAGESADIKELSKQAARLNFPKYNLDEEYDSQQSADAAKRSVEFNRALLVNGFRRLEALEKKEEYDLGMNQNASGEAKISPGDPFAPSVLMSTLCSSSSPVSSSTRSGIIDASAIWEESGVGISCAKMCPPDGRRVAAGCHDAAVRIWSIIDNSNGQGKDASSSSSNGVSETSIVLLGHKNGFPVFDVDWNGDGRTLLSAGGDGSVRLWDSAAVGPYGRLTNIAPKKAKPSATKPTTETVSEGTNIPGLRPESSAEINGAALAVYRGHAPSSPVWSVSFAPSGYYFASAGADGTARLWTTDRPSPVRIFTGHTSPSVNCVKWHPNCNYVLTGSDDKTVRIWDVQSGQCVRLMSGSSLGVNAVAVCPSGRYVAGADAAGNISIWDIGTGGKVNEYRLPKEPSPGSKRDATGWSKSASSPSMIHALTYSACGTALAAGGDDSIVRIWDVRGAASHMVNPSYASAQGWGGGPPMTNLRTQLNRAGAGDQNRGVNKEPVKSFKSRNTVIMDLQYTKHNLLLSVGKYAAALEIPISD